MGTIAGPSCYARRSTPRTASPGSPLNVRGVGNGGQKCTHNCTLPVALVNGDGNPVIGTYDVPTVPNITQPALLGLTAAREAIMLIDTISNRVFMVGPGNYDLMRHLPPGTQQFRCETAPSGHSMLPCAEFSRATTSSRGHLQLEQQIALVVLALLNLLAQQHQVALGNALLQLDDALAVLASVHGSLGQHKRLCALCKLLPLTKLDLAISRTVRYIPCVLYNSTPLMELICWYVLLPFHLLYQIRDPGSNANNCLIFI